MSSIYIIYMNNIERTDYSNDLLFMISVNLNGILHKKGF